MNPTARVDDIESYAHRFLTYLEAAQNRIICGNPPFERRDLVTHGGSEVPQSGDDSFSIASTAPHGGGGGARNSGCSERSAFRTAKAAQPAPQVTVQLADHLIHVDTAGPASHFTNAVLETLNRLGSNATLRCPVARKTVTVSGSAIVILPRRPTPTRICSKEPRTLPLRKCPR